MRSATFAPARRSRRLLAEGMGTSYSRPAAIAALRIRTKPLKASLEQWTSDTSDMQHLGREIGSPAGEGLGPPACLHKWPHADQLTKLEARFWERLDRGHPQAGSAVAQEFKSRC